METIGLIAAMPQESRALLRCVQGWQRSAFGSFRGARFRLVDRDCLLVTSGMGCQRAGAGARALLAAADPQLLVSFGIAGAVEADLRIGDVVVARHACLMEGGLPGQLQPLAALSTGAWEAAAQSLQPVGARLLAGTALTTRGSQLVAELPQELAHPVLEMETVSIAQVAAAAGVPLVSIRSISVGPQAPIPFNLAEIFDENDTLRLGAMLRLVLRRPRLIFQSRPILRNSRIAAAHAARALFAALSQPSPIT